MSRPLILDAYFAFGIATAAWVAARREGWGMRLAAIPLWPFLLPALVGVGRGASAVASPAEARLDALAARVTESWARGPASSVEGQRERQVVERFMGRLRSIGRRIADIEAAVAQAPPRAEAPLRRMAEAASAEMDAGVDLLEELLVQLVLLRFAASASVESQADRARIEDLLARIEAVVSLQAGEY